MVVVHAFNSGTQKAEAVGSTERGSSRSVRATQRNPQRDGKGERKEEIISTYSKVNQEWQCTPL